MAGRLKDFSLALLIALCIYGYFAFGLPYFIVLISSSSFKDERLTKIESLGKFTYGQYTIIKYEFRETMDDETVYEISFMNFIFGKNMTVQTERQKSGTYTIKWVWVGNRFYEKTLRDHPEILAEAEKILQLGRDSFAKAKKKLEEQKLKRNQRSLLTA